MNPTSNSPRHSIFPFISLLSAVQMVFCNSHKMESSQAIVVDCGSHTTKSGFSGERSAVSEVPTVVGRSRFVRCYMVPDEKESYLGREALAKKGTLRLQYPVERGTVTNWDNLEKVWNHVFFDELRVPPEEHGFLLSESPFASKVDREKTLLIAFETFNVPRFYLSNQAELAALSRGLTTALVVDSGEGWTVSTPVSEGYALPYATAQTNIGGGHVTQVLEGLLLGDNSKWTSVQRDCVADLKEKTGYVSLDVEREQTTEQKVDYALPDGSYVSVNEERYLCSEVLFNPSYIKSTANLSSVLIDNLPNTGISTLAWQSLQRCDVGLRSRLYRNVIVAGGCSLFPNFSGRLVQDIRRYLPSAVELVTVSAGKYGVWTGGSILASLEGLNSVWITKEEYEEWGPAVVHRKRP